MARCRHERNSWLIFGEYGEWCYVCGAFRRLKHIGPVSLVPDSKWFKPTGDPDKNPLEKVSPLAPPQAAAPRSPRPGTTRG